MHGLNFDNVEETKDFNVITYARYWHGYLIFLKPLLTFMNFSQIRTTNMVCQIIMLVAIVILMFKRKMGIFIIPFLSVYFLINPLAMSLGLQLATCWNISCVFIILYLIFKDKIVDKKLHYLFFTLLGMCTSYFDLLTTPIMTLGLLLLITLIAENLTLKEAVKRVLICGALWCTGYVTMWAAKWIIATIILNKDVIKDALEVVESRSSNVLSNNTEVSRLDGIAKNFARYDSDIVLPVILVNLFACAVWVVYKFKTNKIVHIETKDSKKYKSGKYYNSKRIKEGMVMNILPSLKNTLPVLGIACMPFVWYVAIANHSQIHAFFTFRTASVFFFGILVAIYYYVRNLITIKKS